MKSGRVYALNRLWLNSSIVFSILMSCNAYSQVVEQKEETDTGDLDFEKPNVEELQRQINQLKSRVDELSNAQGMSSNSQGELQSEIDKTENDLNVKWDPLPVLSSSDGQFSFRTNGRIIYDYGIVNFKDGNGIAVPENKINGTELRALEFGFRGTILRDFNYRFVATFVDNKTEVKMAYADYNFNNFSVVVGFTRTFATLEKSTPAPNTSFAERAAFINAMNIDRRVGIGVTKNGNNWTASVGYYFQDLLTTNSTADDSNLISSRFTYSPTLENGVGLHFGATVFYRNSNNNEYSVRYSSRPFSHQGDLKPLSSERFDVTSEQFYSLEFVTTYQSFGIQSEYGLMINKISPLETLTSTDPNYHGGYFEVSYFPTGGERTMNGKRGRFNDVEVNSPLGQGGIGEVKIAARYDTADLIHDVYGKKQSSYIFGVDWYLNNFVKVQGNYAHSIVKNQSNIDTDIVDTFNLRFLLSW